MAEGRGINVVCVPFLQPFNPSVAACLQTLGMMKGLRGTLCCSWTRPVGTLTLCNYMHTQSWDQTSTPQGHDPQPLDNTVNNRQKTHVSQQDKHGAVLWLLHINDQRDLKISELHR